MFNIFLRYYDTVKLVKTDEDMFNLHNKIEYLASIQWDEDNLFNELCDESDKRVIELAREVFNIGPDDELELEHFKPIGDDDLESYSNVLIINHSQVGPEIWGDDLIPENLDGNFVSKLIPWSLLCDN
jgi:hypothetical protein